MTDFSQWWWQAAAAGPGPGPGPDAGDPIGQSLRFRGFGSSLQRVQDAGNRRTFTYSLWFKKTNSDKDMSQGGAGWFELLATAGEVANRNDFRLEDDKMMTSQISNGRITSTAFYRDPSAWYHIVWSEDTTQSADKERIRFFVNGVLQDAEGSYPSQNSETNVSASGTPFTIGTLQGSSNPRDAIHGYLAAVYFIDGQALEPTTFGRFNSQGVWVPVDAQGLTYGSNGFKLTFEDPSNIGKDYSGNGNDFTATGFDFAPVGVWSNNLFTSTKSTIDFASTNTAFSGGSGPNYAFDGIDNFAANTSATSDSSIIFRPNVAFTNVTEIGVNNGGPTGTPGNQNGFNGGNLTPVAADGRWMTLYSGPPITVDNIFTQSDGQTFVGGFSINGIVLTDNPSGADYDLMQDSPTQNFATLNPIYKNTDLPRYGLLSNANLKSGPGDPINDISISTIAIKSNTYLEFNMSDRGTDQYYPGLAIMDINTPLNPRRYYLYGDGSGDGITNTNPSWTEGDMVQVQMDVTSNPVRVGVAVNNSAYVFNDLAFTSNANIGIGVLGGNNGFSSVNYGQQPFLYTPPAGFEALQTQNLPTPAILDGREHFQAIVGSGQGADGTVVPGQLAGNWGASASISGGPDDLSPIFNGSESSLVVSTQQQAVFTLAPTQTYPFSTLEVRTDPNADGAWDSQSGSHPGSGTQTWTVATNGELSASKPLTVTARPSTALVMYAVYIDGKMLVDANILSIAQSTFPNGLWWIKDRANSNQHQLVDSVNGQSAVITSPAGSVTAYAAPAGSSVAWCWNAANTDGGFSITDGTHGLGAIPAFVIDRALNVWHQSLPAGQGLVLKSNAAATSQTWTVDGTTVSGPGGGSYYSWAEIPGYSSFGVYQGNANADGPFIYTGHSVAWLMVKSSDQASNWFIYDSTREVNNPMQQIIMANTDGGETPADTGANGVDFLSNGFKLRSTNGSINSANEYVYAAFASCPFQSPATAR